MWFGRQAVKNQISGLQNPPTSEKTFVRIEMSQVPRQLEDAITQLSFAQNALGVSEKLSFIQPDLTFDAQIRKTPLITLEVFFSEPPQDEFFSQVKVLSPGIQWRLSQEAEQDWLSEWKKNFKAFRFCRDVWVIPSWLKAPDEARYSIFIDPGMAFGTGTHATTKMAAELTAELLLSKTEQERKLLKLLDVGTGTGILALLAHKLGVETSLGIEIDLEARRKAKENIRLNRAQTAITIADYNLDEESEKFDFVIANIIDGALINIQSDLDRVLHKGGDLVTSGILLEREDHFIEKFIEARKWQVVRRLEMDEWVAFWLRKPMIN